MRHRFPNRASITAILLSAACGTEGASVLSSSTNGDCAAATAKLQSCFPGEAVPPTCDEATAVDIASQSCSELQASGGKSDSPLTCLWMPWLCAGGSTTTPSETEASALTIAVSHCWGSAFSEDDCSGTSSLSCAQVVLFDASGSEVARAFSGEGGITRFDDIEPGTYTVRVLDRSGKLAKQVVGDLATSVEPAEIVVDVTSEPTRAELNLTMASQETVRACSFVGVDLLVTNAAGEKLDPDEVEWSWIVRYERPDGEIELTRPFRYGAEAETEADVINRFGVHRIYSGEHTFEAIRVDIPSYERKNNPDYESLLERRRVDGVDAQAITLKVLKKDLPTDLEFETSIVDPLAE
ncbi:MAG: hypothetical protein IV100_26065 [Myxococcales bacterium]|nr:hypothetical protein [Myxococcales bacterium]